MGFISHLPNCLINHLHSSSVLSNFPQAVEELVCNSLDAGATKISMYVDVASFYIKVDDDGSGITRDDLMLIGERHATSKLHNLQDLENGVATLGFRGEALSSLSEVAIIELVTRIRGSPNTYKKVIKGSRKLSMGICSEQRTPGTTVIVRDLFHNLPVRRKNMETSSRKVLQGVKDHIVRLALIHPHVSFTAIDLERQGKLVQTNRCSSSLDSFCTFFGEQYRTQLVNMDYKKKDLKLNGFISTVEGSKLSIKTLQFVYINGRFVHKTPIHKLINSFFSGSMEFRNNNEAWIEASKQGFPAFVLDLSCSLSCYDITFEATKTSVEFKDWKYVVSFVKEALETVWSASMIRTSNGGRAEIDLNEEVGISARSNNRKRKPWQHIDPTYYPNLNVDTAKHKGDLQCRSRKLRSNNINNNNQEDELLFTTPKQKSGHRKRKQYGVREEYGHNSIDLMWSLQHCKTEKQKNLELFDRMPFNMQHDNDRFTSRSPEDSLNWENGFDISCQNTDFECVWDLGSRHYKHSSNVKISRTQKNLELVDYQPLDMIHDSNSTNGMSKGAQWDKGHGTQHQNSDFETTWSLDSRKCKILTDVIEVGMSNERICAVKDGTPHHDLLSEYYDAVDSELEKSSIPLHVFDSHARTGKVPLDSHSEILLHVGEKNREEANLDKDSNIFEYVETQSLIRSDYLPDRPNVRRCLYEVALQPSSTDGLFSCIERQRVNDFSITSVTDKEWSPRFESSLFDTNLPEDRLYNDEYEVQNQEKEWQNSDDVDFDLDEASSMVVKDTSLDKEFLASEAEDNKSMRLRTLSGPPFFKPPWPEHQIQCKIFEFQGNEVLEASKDNIGKEPTLYQEDLQKGLCDLAVNEKGDGVLRSTGSNEDSVINVHDDFSLWSKWRDPDQFDHHKCSPTDAHVSAAQLYKEWKNPCMSSNQLHVLDVSSINLVSSKGRLLPRCISKEELCNARVLQQIEKKFIAAVADNILVVIDQHAADERVRLEQLREEVLKETQHSTSLLDYPKELTISTGDQQLLYIYQSHLEYWGWRFKFQSQKSKYGGAMFRRMPESDGNMHVLLTAVPMILGETLTDTKYLSEYLHQLAATDGISAPPPAVLRIMASKACRGAIMFGDCLLRSECQQLVEGLKKTSLSFQCAHGRPTLVPIVNLQVLGCQLSRLEGVTAEGQSEFNTPVYKKKARTQLRKAWHNLEWHRPTLQRALERFKHGVEK